MIAIFFLIMTSIAQAGGITYCVGGFDINSPTAEGRHACNSQKVRRMHPDWHRHGMIVLNKKTKECFVCWDEVDSTCDSIFMAEHQTRYQYVFTTAQCKKSNKHKVKFHVKDGVSVLKKKPKPNNRPDKNTRPNEAPGQSESQSVVLIPKLTLRKGPYTQGETIRVTGSLVDQQGRISKQNGIVVTPDAATISLEIDGQLISSVPVIILPDGSFEADVTLPKQDGNMLTQLLSSNPDVSVVLNVSSKGLPDDYSLSTNKVRKDIEIGECIQGLEFSTPLDGSKTAALIPTNLEAYLKSSSKSPNISFEILFPDSSLLKEGSNPQATIPAQNGKAVWIPLELQDTRDTAFAKITAFGDLDGAKICPTNPIMVEVSGESILPETTISPRKQSELENLPPQFQGQNMCLVGKDCDVQIEVKTPAQTSVEFLNDPDTAVSVIDNMGKVLYSSTLGSSQTIAYTFVPAHAGHETPVIRFRGKDGQMHNFDATPITVRDPISLTLPDPIDFGHVTEDNWLGQCHLVQLKASGLEARDGLRISAKGFEKECNMELYYIGSPNSSIGLDALKIPLEDSGEGFVDILLSGNNEFGICVRPGDCGASDSPELASISLTPLDPVFQPFGAESKTIWQSEKQPFWAWTCWGEFLSYLFGFSALMGLVLGYTRPPRFEKHVFIKMSTKKNMNKNLREYVLAEEPCRSFKMFRGDRIMFSDIGEPCLSDGFLHCKAVANGGVSVNGTALEMYQERDGKWIVIEEDDHVPMGSKLYRLKGQKTYLKFFV